VLATTLFSGPGLSFVASMLIAMKVYRVRAPRPADAQRGPATPDAAVLAAIRCRAGAAQPGAAAA
jgi:hypothetical protein